jgi:hypothetical protein
MKILAPLIAAGGGLAALLVPTLLWVARNRRARDAALRGAGRLLKKGAQQRLDPPAQPAVPAGPPTYRGVPLHICPKAPTTLGHEIVTVGPELRKTNICPFCGESLSP